jgi:hypothetical protein
VEGGEDLWVAADDARVVWVGIDKKRGGWGNQKSSPVTFTKAVSRLENNRELCLKLTDILIKILIFPIHIARQGGHYN